VIKVAHQVSEQPPGAVDHDYYRDQHLLLIRSRRGVALKYYTTTGAGRRGVERPAYVACATCYGRSRRTGPRLAHAREFGGVAISLK
jgi:hypothetical protein